MSKESPFLRLSPVIVMYNLFKNN